MINSQVLSNFYYGITVVICIIFFNFIVPNLKFKLHSKYVNITKWIKEKYCVCVWFVPDAWGGGGHSAEGNWNTSLKVKRLLYQVLRWTLFLSHLGKTCRIFPRKKIIRLTSLEHIYSLCYELTKQGEKNEHYHKSNFYPATPGLSAWSWLSRNSLEQAGLEF